MPMTPPHATRPSAGLSAHARDLWQASLLYRRLADDLGASSTLEPRQMPAEATEDEPWPAFR